MTSAALLDQDFGSESEDDNFNPAPADDSDNDAAGENDNAVTERPRTNGSEQTRRPTHNEGHNDEEDTMARPKELHGTGRGRGGGVGGEDNDAVGEDDDDTKPNGAGGDDEDDEEDDEDEDDEDEEVSVCLPSSTRSHPCLTNLQLGSAPKTSTSGSSKPVP